jgi:AraC-like DNA-binding protein
MDGAWLQRISPCPRPVLIGMPEDCACTGRSFQHPKWVEPLRVIYDHELVLIGRGTFRTEIDGREYLCPENSFIIIPPGQWEATWNIGAVTGRRSWCHFDWAYVDGWDSLPLMTYHPAKPRRSLFRKAPDFVPRRILQGTIHRPDLAFDLFERLFQRQNLGDRHDQLLSRSLLLELLIHLLNPRAEKRLAKRVTLHLADRVRKQLKNAVESGSPIPSIRAMLEKSRYSYAHLCRLFHAQYGITPLKYVHTLRIDRAKLLLRDTSFGISEIVYRVGFNDPVYFSQLFRRITGSSPSRYRQDH